MIAGLKQTVLAKALWRTRDRPVLGLPARGMTWVSRIEWLQPSHMQTRNRRHNARQRAILAAFEAETRRQGQ